MNSPLKESKKTGYTYEQLRLLISKKSVGEVSDVSASPKTPDEFFNSFSSVVPHGLRNSRHP